MKKDTQTLSRNIADYEQVIKDQRKRIIDLRDENTALKSRLAELEQERDNVTQALISAQQSKSKIIEEARLKAAKITADAEAVRKKSELSLKYHCSSLKELEVRCERILDSISRELNKTEGTNLRLIK